MHWLLSFLLNPAASWLLSPQLTQVANSIWGIKDSPDLPDYSGAAKSTSDSSVQAAITNSYLNRPNESTPYGTRSWNQTGQNFVPGVGGQAGFWLPEFQSNINFTPEGKQLFDKNFSMQNSMAGAGVNAAGQVESALRNPMDLSGAPKVYGEQDLQQNRQAVQDAMYERAMKQLQPGFDLEKRNTDTDLINRGFSVGNEGYTKEMDNVSRRQGAQRQDALDSAIMAGGAEQSRLAGLSLNDRQQAISEMLMQRQLPMTELSALMGGSAPQLNNFQPFNASANSQGANYLGAAGAQGQAELARYGLDTQRMNAMWQNMNEMNKQGMQGAGMMLMGGG